MKVSTQSEDLVPAQPGAFARGGVRGPGASWRLFPFLAPALVGWACAAAPPQDGNLLANSEFEAQGGPVPPGWTLAGAVEGKGEIEVVSTPVHGGNGAVCLRPNRTNTADILSFSIGQGMGLDPLRGRTLKARGWVLGRGGATGVLALYVIAGTGSVVTQMRLTSTSSSYTRVEGELEIPDEGGSLLVINAHAEGSSGEACFDDLDVQAEGSVTGERARGGGATGVTGQGQPLLVVNPSFEEEEPGDLPAGWTLEDRVAGKGSVALVTDPSRSGKALRLRPNASNTPGPLGLSVGQGLPAESLRGGTLRVAGWIGAEGGATAVLTVRVIDQEGGILQSRRLARDRMPPATEEGRIDVPTSREAALVILSAGAEGTSGSAYFDDVRLEQVSARERGGQAESEGRLSATVWVDGGAEGRPIPRTLYGQNLEWPHGGNLIRDFRREAMNRELVSLTRELGPELLRFPGGFFADFYHWRDGVGPVDRRPTTEIFPGGDSSANVFGTDEALTFADQVGAELLVTVNAHTGTPREAAAWVEYVNGGRSPPRVRFWEVGNEFYIRNDDAANAAIPPEEYASRLLAFSEAILDADPEVKILGIGAENYGRYDTSAFPDWDPIVLARAGAAMDYLAVHNAYFPVLFGDEGAGFEEVYRGLLAAPVLIAENLRTLTRQIQEYAPGRGDSIEIAVTEWGPLFHLDPGSRWIDHVKTLGSALFVASTLKVFIDDPRTTLASAFKLNDIAYQGWIGARSSSLLTDEPTSHDFRPTAPYFAMQMFTRHFGETWIPSRAEGPTFDARPVGVVGEVRDAPWLDVVASRSRRGDTLYIMGINKHFTRPIESRIQVDGFPPGPRAEVWVLEGTGMDANTGTRLPDQITWGEQAQNPENPRFQQGGPDEVRILRRSVEIPAGTFSYAFPPHSVTTLAIPRGGR